MCEMRGYSPRKFIHILIANVKVEYDPTYSASEIAYQNCIDCGEEYRYEGKSHPIPKKYEKLDSKGYNVCKSCFIREYFKDMDER